MQVQAYVGIDVSKKTLDVCLIQGSGKIYPHIFSNNQAGYKALISWVRKESTETICFCMEATGTFYVALATFLNEANEFVSVVNPANIKYSGPHGASNKTDKADAKKIAFYAKHYQPARWAPPSPEHQLLTALVRHRDMLIEERTKNETRLKTPELVAPVQTSIEQILKVLNEQIKLTDDKIRDHINKNDGLKDDFELLKSIPGIGDISAAHLLAEMPNPTTCKSASAAAAYAGLAPLKYQSGTSINRPTKLSKRGNCELRRAMYFPAITAIRYNPVIADLAKRLEARGKAKMAIVGAAMRKLIMLAYGVLKTRQFFKYGFTALQVEA